MLKKGAFWVVAPHADDELIGCFSLFIEGLVDRVFFGTFDALQEAQKSWDNSRIGLKDTGIPFPDVDNWKTYAELNKELIDLIHLPRPVYIFVPDPVYEYHPLHRTLGSGITSHAHLGSVNVVYYSTNMNAPYLREFENPDFKKDVLNTVYHLKSDLWKYDHKYFLFEGFLMPLLDFRTIVSLHGRGWNKGII